MKKMWMLGVVMAGVAGAQSSPVVNPGNNALLGHWVYSSGGLTAGSCEKTRTFEAHTQSWVLNGPVVTASATYAVSGKTVYVQQHPGSGGTVAYVVVSKDEIMNTMGTGACHWKRQ